MLYHYTVIGQVTEVMVSCKPVYRFVHDLCTVTWNVSDYCLYAIHFTISMACRYLAIYVCTHNSRQTPCEYLFLGEILLYVHMYVQN